MNQMLLGLKSAIRQIFENAYPDLTIFANEHYSIEDLVNQAVFELIKEDYKKNAPRKTIQQHFVNFNIDPDDFNRKFYRASQYVQQYREWDNDRLEKESNIRIPELEAISLKPENRKTGHTYNAVDFIGLMFQAGYHSSEADGKKDEYALFDKMLCQQIDDSSKVSVPQFKLLFKRYMEQLDDIEPKVDNASQVIERTLAYYGFESTFHADFISRLSIVAEKYDFSEQTIATRILPFCNIELYIPRNNWCCELYAADLQMLMKRDEYCDEIFSANQERWEEIEDFLYDCRRLKGVILKPNTLDGFLKVMLEIPEEDKAAFICDNYWIWDKRLPYDEIWTDKRVQLFRKIHASISDKAPKPKVK